jgi:signal transduction histidine kinase
LLVLYRWISLVPPLIFFWTSAPFQPPLAWALLVAIAATAVISLFPYQLNSLLRRQPAILLLDLILCAALIGLSGGARSPYYLYSLSPVLAAAFFFQIRGALVAAAGAAALFTAAVLGAGAAPDWTTAVAQVVGYFLIGGTLGYQPTLLARLSGARDDLNRAHRDLNVISDLTVSLQNAADVFEVEERVLEAVTGDLGFQTAVIALVDPNENAITSWLGKSRDGRALFAGGLPHPARVPLAPESGLIAQSLLDGHARFSTTGARTSDPEVNRHLGDGLCHIFPMILREHPVGVLVVDAAGDGSGELLVSLQSIASQAAVAVGTTLLCIDRAQRLAVQEERIRIAREIHDTASQSLFGLVYSLEACIKLLPDQPAQVKQELQELQGLAEATRVELRQSILDIWPTQITAERFAADLRKYVNETCGAQILDLQINVQGDFERASPLIRRSLYRIAQEALTNTVHHAAARSASVCLCLADDQAALSVRDDGRGFDPALGLARERNREHFGLHGMQARAASLGGWCEFLSGPGEGATVIVSIPVG